MSASLKEVRSDEVEQISPAVRITQKRLELQKRAERVIKDSKNPFHKNSYASLEAVLNLVRPICSNLGLVLSQTVLSAPNGGMVVQTAITDVETGESAGSQFPLPADLSAKPQDVMAASTYSRRYGLLTFLALPAEDDDGETASGRGDQSSKPAKKASKKQVKKVATITDEQQTKIGELANQLVEKKIFSGIEQLQDLMENLTNVRSRKELTEPLAKVFIMKLEELNK